MNASRPQPGRSIGMTRLVLVSALFLTAVANLAFFRNLAQTFGTSPQSALHLVSLGLVLLCAIVLFLTLFSFRPVVKPALAVLFLASATAAYFMDSFNVIIDRDMLQNVVATNAAETADLVTPRLLLYLLVIGVLPSALVVRLRIRRDAAWPAMRNRLLTAAAALASMLLLVVMSGSFYASFVREHKHLRYYANPLTPIYSAWKLARTHAAPGATGVQAIGLDARIPPTDADRELVIMVVGETARADHFSLNGYARETNPGLEPLPLVSFTNVSACGTSTETAVPCMFDMFSREDFDAQSSRATENVLDVLAHAGVTVLWRDNNSDSKGVALRLPEEDYRSPDLNPDCDEECRDRGMLQGLHDFVDQHPSGDILVVLHQMGSHGPAYSKRYPPEFEYFKPSCISSQLDECSQAEILNAYDNSIRYTDYFLTEVIGFLSEFRDGFDTAMLYVGDHGESLGESGVYLHGLPYWMAPAAQTRVPLIFWFGANYDDADPDRLRLLRHQAFSHDNIFHTLLGLFEVTSEVYEESKDLLHLSRTAVPQTAPSDAPAT